MRPTTTSALTCLPVRVGIVRFVRSPTTRQRRAVACRRCRHTSANVRDDDRRQRRRCRVFVKRNLNFKNELFCNLIHPKLLNYMFLGSVIKISYTKSLALQFQFRIRSVRISGIPFVEKFCTSFETYVPRFMVLSSIQPLFHPQTGKNFKMLEQTIFCFL